MANIREFVFQGVGFETKIKVDVSEFDHITPEAKRDRALREEVARKGIQWFKEQPDESLELSVMFGIYEHKPEMTPNDYTGPFDNFGCMLLEKSPILKRRSDVWLGRCSPFSITKKMLQDPKHTQKPDELYP